MIFIFGLISLFIAWIWIDYYRLIDIYDKEKLFYILFTFAGGAASVFLVLFAHDEFEMYKRGMNGEFFHDLMYSIVEIGLVEEVAKAIPFLLTYVLFRKQFNEPIDYIAFISFSALGFSAAENTLYFEKYGPSIMNSRAILASVGHMFDSAIFAYGIVLMKYRSLRFKELLIPAFLALAAISHGFYDFWLMYEDTKSWGWIVTIVYFLVTISIFATIINNSLNNSEHFTYKQIVDSSKVSKQLLIYYACVLLIEHLLLVFYFDIELVMLHFSGTLLTMGFIVVITVVRMSRLKLIKGRWNPIPIEFPVAIGPGHLVIRGMSTDEIEINKYYQDYFSLMPVSPHASELKNSPLTYIDSKIFLKDDSTFYVARIYSSDKNSAFENRLLIPKLDGNTKMHGVFPIVGILKISKPDQLNDTSLSASDFEFQEWAFIMKEDEKSGGL